MSSIFEGLVFVWECLVLADLSSVFLGLKNKGLKLAKAFGVSLPLALIYAALTYAEGMENISVIMLMLFMLGYTFLFLNGKPREKIIISAVPAVTALPINLIAMSIMNYLAGNDKTAEGTMRFWVLLLNGVLLFVVCCIISGIRKKHSYQLTASQLTVQISCFLVSFLIALLLWNISAEQSEISSFFPIIYVLIGILNILLYIIMNKMQRDNVIKEEYNLLKANISAQERLAVEIRDRYSEVKTIKHDIKHYLTAAAELISDNKPDEARLYIERIINEKIDSSVIGVNTGSAVVDAVINNKISLCARTGIKTKCIIDTQFESANDIDISILLSNLLDNAIAGCGTSDPQIAPQVEIIMSLKKALTYIAVKNSISESVLARNPNLETDKPNKSEHGFGIRSVKNIAEKYDGSVDFTEENGFFIAEVWLKMKK